MSGVARAPKRCNLRSHLSRWCPLHMRYIYIYILYIYKGLFFHLALQLVEVTRTLTTDTNLPPRRCLDWNMRNTSTTVFAFKCCFQGRPAKVEAPYIYYSSSVPLVTGHVQVTGYLCRFVALGWVTLVCLCRARCRLLDRCFAGPEGHASAKHGDDTSTGEDRF